MAKNEQQKPKSILEALGSRGEETEPEVTTEEHVVEALSSASLMDRMESEQYPEGEMPMQERQGIANPPAAGKQEIPASNTVPPLAAETSTPELQEHRLDRMTEEEVTQKQDQAMEALLTPIDENLRRLKDYVNGELYSINWVRLHLIHMSRIPSALPSLTLWNLPGKFDVANFVYDVALSPGYVETKWPVLQVLLGSAIDNVEWAVGVLTTLALFDGINLLPYAGIQVK